MAFTDQTAEMDIRETIAQLIRSINLASTSPWAFPCGNLRIARFLKLRKGEHSCQVVNKLSGC